MNIQIPAQSSFDFNEICTITEVKPYVLRFWESEFTQIDPVKSDNGQKVYDLTDLYVILKIKELLFEDKLSIQQAKHKFMEGVDLEMPSFDNLPQSSSISSQEFAEDKVDSNIEKLSAELSQYSSNVSINDLGNDLGNDSLNESEHTQLESALELSESDLFNQQVDQLAGQYAMADVNESLRSIKQDILDIKLKHQWQ